MYDKHIEATHTINRPGRRFLPGNRKETTMNSKPLPNCPCRNCPDKNNVKTGTCNGGFGICKAYLDYQHRLSTFRKEKKARG